MNKKPIKGFPSYWVTDEGKVYSKFRELKPQISGKTHHRVYNVCLINKGQRASKNIHTLVANAFLPNPEGLSYVCHKDGNILNNRLDNLFWGTRYFSINDCLAQGLTLKQLRKIKVEGIKSLNKVANKYNLSREVLLKIINFKQEL